MWIVEAGRGGEKVKPGGRSSLSIKATIGTIYLHRVLRRGTGKKKRRGQLRTNRLPAEKWKGMERATRKKRNI